MTGLFGGAFDPPHNGHAAFLAAAARRFELERLVVLVVADPGHKEVATDASTRLELARLAFPEYEVELDRNARTVDTLRGGDWDDPLFLIGADEFADFLTWKEPQAVLELARLGVGTRPGYPRERLDAVLAGLDRPECVTFFELEPVPVSSRELRARVARGEAIDGLVPSAVAEAIEGLGLYRSGNFEAGQDVSSPQRGGDRRAGGGGERRQLHFGRDLRRGLTGLTSLEQARRIAALAQEKLAKDVVILDMRPVCTYTDFFVICTGQNPRQTKAIFDEVHARLKHDERVLPQTVEGAREATWILGDYLDVVLHVFTPDTRAFYRLEDLWGDVPSVELEAAAS